MAAAFASSVFAGDVDATSAGTEAILGARAAAAAVAAMQPYRIDLHTHRATEVEDLRLDRYDIIVALDDGIAMQLVDAGAVTSKDQLEIWDVEDPSGSRTTTYPETAKKIRSLVDGLHARLWPLAASSNARRREALIAYIDQRLPRVKRSEITGSNLLGVFGRSTRQLELILRKEYRLTIAQSSTPRSQDEPRMLGEVVRELKKLWRGRGSPWIDALADLKAIVDFRNSVIHPDADRDRELDPAHVAQQLADILAVAKSEVFAHG